MRMRPHGTATAALAVLLAACAPSGVTASQAQPHDKENPGMDTTRPAHDDGTPTAPQLLEGLLRLIEGSASVKDFTPERLEQELKLPIKVVSEDNWGASVRLTADWWVNLDQSPSRTNAFLLRFGPDQPEAVPPMSGICGLDMEQFGRRLVGLGLQHETNYVEHGRALSERYSRPGLEVEVLSRSEADAPEEKRQHQCVQMVIVR